MTDCLCKEVPALPGIPSDNRWDHPDCPKHHPETVTPQHISVWGEFQWDLSAKEWFAGEDVPKGLTSEQLAKMLAENWRYTFNERDLIVMAKVDDQEAVEVKL